MADAALEALYRSCFASDDLAAAEQWWFADEQVTAPPPARPGWRAFSNRIDVARSLQAAGYPCALGDFELAGAPRRVVYRVSKEKPLVHFLLNQAMAALPLGGELLLAGFKRDGLHSYAKNAASLLGERAEIRKAGQEAYIARLCKRREPEGQLDDRDYRHLRPILDAPLLVSKPGIFGWQKIDRGSALLCEQLPSFLAGFAAPPETRLDLGCGYGYIAVMANTLLPGGRWYLTDNNATALLAAEANCRQHGMDAELVLADCADSLTESVDCLLCNPPFHQGFAVEGELTERFVKAAHRLLHAGGQALFVVNQFIPLERHAAGLFIDCRELARRDGFRLIALRR